MTKANLSSKLRPCPKCRDDSVAIKVYYRVKDFPIKGKRVMYCINKGCGYRQSIPFPEEVK